MLRKSITDITEPEFLVFVKRISAVDYAIKDEDNAAILLSEELTGHPAASDAIDFFEMPETMKIRQWQDTSLSDKEIGSTKPKKQITFSMMVMALSYLNQKNQLIAY
ncbi:bacteriocin immunity protein [Klebsiella aerogenes]